MPNTRNLIVAMALALVALPAAAGSAPERSTTDGFAYVGGDGGWHQLIPPVFAWNNGRLVRPGPTELDVQAPSRVTTRDLEETARLYPGG